MKEWVLYYLWLPNRQRIKITAK